MKDLFDMNDCPQEITLATLPFLPLTPYEQVDAGGNGDCFYAALAVPYGSNKEALRKAINTHLLLHPTHYSPFFEPSESSPRWEDMVTRQGQQGTYADNIAVQAASNVTNSTLLIHTATTNGGIINIIRPQGASNLPTSHTVHLLLTNEHYKYLRKKPFPPQVTPAVTSAPPPTSQSPKANPPTTEVAGKTLTISSSLPPLEPQLHLHVGPLPSP